MKTIHVTLPGGAQLQGVLREPTPEMPAYQTRPAVWCPAAAIRSSAAARPSRWPRRSWRPGTMCSH